MSNLLLLVERQADRIRKACEEYDSVTFANLLHQLLSEAADSYLAKSAREKLVCAIARLAQAGKDLNAPQIVAILREAAAFFLNGSSLRPVVAVVIDRPEAIAEVLRGVARFLCSCITAMPDSELEV
jgi:hypothetical protein